MAYKKGEERRQKVFFPDCIDDYVDKDAPVRLFDAFVDRLDMDMLEFERSTPKDTGTPGYDPRDLLKLYIYGYFYQVRSSRKLARECKCNVEVMWLLGKLYPDFRTISDFRKDNKNSITKVFKEFNKFCMGLKLFSKSYISIDGSKFKAVNAKDKNFTLNKLDDRIKRLEESNQKQLSLTDSDARLMKSNEGFCVGYNVQTAVDADSHMIAGFQVTNNPTDHDLITNVATGVKEDYGVDILETTADKGYECPEDHADALASGVIPNVIQRDGGCIEQVEFDHLENAITDEQKASTNPEDLKICLQAGVIPDAYNGILTDMEIVEVRKRTLSMSDSSVLSMTPEQMRAKAIEGFFVRDAERNLVYCSQGEILRQKSIKQNGNIRYCNKLACKRCKSKCTASRFKEADFGKDDLIKATDARKKQDVQNNSNNNKPKLPRTTIVKKVVRYMLHLDKKKMDNRKSLSEHPFGTIKRTLGQYYFLLKGFAKVSAEMGLFGLSYNLRRAITLKGVPFLVAALR